MDIDFYYHSLLPIHLFFGYVALVSAFGAIFANKGRKIHRFCGKIFLFGVTGVFLTVLPMSYIKFEIFQLLGSIMGTYLTYSGYIYARTHNNRFGYFAWTLSIAMLAFGVLTSAYVLYAFMTEPRNIFELSLYFFGGIVCAWLCMSDLKIYYDHNQKGGSRIIKHMTAMLISADSVVTAFIFPTFPINRPIITLIGPSIVTFCIVIWWRKRLKRPSKITRYINLLEAQHSDKSSLVSDMKTN